MEQEDKLAIVAHGFADDPDYPLTHWWDMVYDQFESWGYEVLEAEFDSIGRTVDSPEKYAHEFKNALEEHHEEKDGDYSPETVAFSHSMGGHIVDYSIQELECGELIDTCVKAGTPPEGTYMLLPLAIAGIEGAQDLTYGSDFLENLYKNNVPEEVDYLNIWASNDPAYLLMRDEHAEMLEKENVTNLKIGQDRLEVNLENLESLLNASSNIVDDYIQDMKDLIDVGTSLLSLKVPDFDKLKLRATDSKMIGLRASQLYTAAAIDAEDFFTGHITMLYNDKTWKEIADYLGEEKPKSVQPVDQLPPKISPKVY